MAYPVPCGIQFQFVAHLFRGEFDNRILGITVGLHHGLVGAAQLTFLIVGTDKGIRAGYLRNIPRRWGVFTARLGVGGRR